MFGIGWRNLYPKLFQRVYPSKTTARYYGLLKDEGKSRILVCDLSSGLAAPYCGMMLGDMGANVIKVESYSGDESRDWGTSFIGEDMSSCYLAVNRNKKSIQLDVNDDKDKDVLLQLIDKCDVLIENFQPGKMRDLGMSYPTLQKRNRGLIHASISCFGSDGPLSKKPGHEGLLAAAYGGLLSVTGTLAGQPCAIGAPAIELMTALYASSAILAALYERMNTGVGREVSTSMLQVELAFLSHLGSNYLNDGSVGKMLGTSHGSIVPYQALKTKDKMIIIAATNEKHFRNMCQVLDMLHVLNDERFSSNKRRVENREFVISTIETRLQNESSDFWIDRLGKSNVPCSYVNDVKSAFESPQSHALSMIQSFTYPTVGEVKIPGPAIDWKREDAPLPPPMLGEHTVEILKDVLSFSSSDVEKFLSRRNLGQHF